MTHPLDAEIERNLSCTQCGYMDSRDAKYCGRCGVQKPIKEETLEERYNRIVGELYGESTGDEDTIPCPNCNRRIVPVYELAKGDDGKLCRSRFCSLCATDIDGYVSDLEKQLVQSSPPEPATFMSAFRESYRRGSEPTAKNILWGLFWIIVFGLFAIVLISLFVE